ncbi:hypothetical protein N0V90_000976 [Kalmusia sp. IMI 367209]|nr:hypothetical protein N0V90_000976 [Kalmusia sp. IMI 367209]
MNDGTSLHISDDLTTAPQSKKEMVKSQGEGLEARKQDTSGGILRNLPFLRTSAKNDASKPTQGDEKLVDIEGTKRSSVIATALRHGPGRKRKGSLRQGILGKNMLGRDPQRSQRTSTKPPTIHTHMAATTSEEDEATPRPINHDNASRNSSSDIEWPPSAGLSMSTSTTRSSSYYDLDEPTSRLLASPITGSTAPYASTTDDDEAVSFYRPSPLSGSSYNANEGQVAGSDLSLPRRRTTRATQHTSLANIQSPIELSLEDEWDYSETEWWGWIILIMTWIVFVVGMGSCLGVWSWAWDVGETPYAPPELEDDPTLPITGYYPALMICTAVMAWVWVVVAWVGMKYFRHAKMSSRILPLTATHGEPFAFFDLPREVRDHVLSYLVVRRGRRTPILEAKTIIRDQKKRATAQRNREKLNLKRVQTGRPPVAHRDILNEPMVHLGAMRASRLLHHEAKDLFYQRNQFAISLDSFPATTVEIPFGWDCTRIKKMQLEVELKDAQRMNSYIDWASFFTKFPSLVHLRIIPSFHSRYYEWARAELSEWNTAHFIFRAFFRELLSSIPEHLVLKLGHSIDPHEDMQLEGKAAVSKSVLWSMYAELGSKRGDGRALQAAAASQIID